MVIRMKKMISLLLVSALTLSLAGCQGGAQGTAQSGETSKQAETQESTQAAGDGETEASDMDEEAEKTDTQGDMTPWINTNVAGSVTEDMTAQLKDDFYLAANYDYLKDTQIREGLSGEGSFQEVRDIIDERLMEIMTNDTAQGHDAQLVQELYAMWLDWDGRNRAGISQLMPHIEKIQQIETLEDLTGYLSSEEGLIYGARLSGAEVTEDLEDVRWYCVDISGTPLSLGDSDEYEKLTSIGERALKAYREKALLLLKKAGYDEKEAEEITDNAYAFEEDLAPAILSLAETHASDYLERVLNRMTMEELAQLSPNYPLTEIIKAMGLGDSERIFLEQPEWLSQLNKLYTEENLENIKSYILVHTLLTYGELFDEETYRELVRISNEASGIAGSKTDEKLALETVKAVLKTSVSKVYVEEYITEEMRDDVESIIKDCISAYRTMLSAEDWLSAETKEKTLEKLDSLAIHAVYPDKWEDTEGLNITPRAEGGNYFTAIVEIRTHEMELNKKRVNTMVDRETWANGMELTDVNASYTPMNNSINIYPGILNGTFYRSDMTEEEKLAGIGTVIGHEISHAFDTLGAQFDKDGNFANWWTDEDYAAFEARAQKLIAYYDTIIPFDQGEHYPGSNVQGEAIADIAGMKCMLILAGKQEGFDYDTFFRSFAALWRGVYSREACESRVYQNEHPMYYLRVNVTLMQQPEFYETYDIKEEDGMYMAEEDRIAVW